MSASGSRKTRPTRCSTTTASSRSSGTGQNSTISKSVAPARRSAALTMPSSSSIIPQGYKARAVQPAKNYDVVSFARTMNDDFGHRVKKLFDPEREAALEAQQTGMYIGWRCPEFNHDCQRVGSNGKCFCGHLLMEHKNYNAKTVLVPCNQPACTCKGFAWIPSRPEEVGEYWFQKRQNFDVSTWRSKCRCKHSHEEHEPNGLHRCRFRGCGCGAFNSNFLCAACDRHWEDHQTFFETAMERQKKGLPVGAEYLPFAEIPSLRNMVLSGKDDEDMSYMAINPGPFASAPSAMRALPSGSMPQAASNVMPPGGRSRHAKTNFSPVYD